MTFRLDSPAFATGGRIPTRYTCDGENLSPPLSWSGAPAGTRSFALVCSDPDAPAGTFHHWAVFDIPPDATGLAEGLPTGTTPPFAHAQNDFRRAGYSGPCPPRGHGAHRYRFALYALKVPALGLPGLPGCRDVERAARTHALAETELVGTYAR